MEESKGVSDTAAKAVSDSNPSTIKEDAVSYESHKKLLAQLKKTQEQNKELAEYVKRAQEQQKSNEEQKLHETGEYKKLMELREREANELKTKLTETERAKTLAEKDKEDMLKLNAFMSKLPGRIKNREYYVHVPLDKIVFDPSTGDIDPQSLDLAASEFVENHSDLLDKKSFPRLPGEAAMMNSAAITPDNFRNIPLKEMRAKAAEAVRLAKKKL